MNVEFWVLGCCRSRREDEGSRSGSQFCARTLNSALAPFEKSASENRPHHLRTCLLDECQCETSAGGEGT